MRASVVLKQKNSHLQASKSTLQYLDGPAQGNTVSNHWNSQKFIDDDN